MSCDADDPYVKGFAKEVAADKAYEAILDARDLRRMAKRYHMEDWEISLERDGRLAKRLERKLANGMGRTNAT